MGLQSGWIDPKGSLVLGTRRGEEGRDSKNTKSRTPLEAETRMCQLQH